jgi:ankyrin repeat protein
VAAVGYACEASPCIPLCGITYRRGDKGATNDMLARSLELQCGASAPRAVRREDFVVDPAKPFRVTIRGTTQLMRATITNDLPRVLRLIHLGAPLDLADGSWGLSALHWACKCGHARIAEALLDGTGSGGSGAPIDLQTPEFGATPLGLASQHGRADIVRMLLARGARQELGGGRRAEDGGGGGGGGARTAGHGDRRATRAERVRAEEDRRWSGAAVFERCPLSRDCRAQRQQSRPTLPAAQALFAHSGAAAAWPEK